MSEKYVIGIDLGGTNTVIGLVDVKGHILAKDDTIKTQAHPDIEEYTDSIAAVIKKLATENGCEGKLEGVGVGAPMANYYTGEIVNAANLPWKGIVPLGWLIESKTGIPTKVTNDANAAAIGEMKYGVAQGMKDFVYITLGTGVGSGIVANGQLIYGHDGFAGEFGHIAVESRTTGRQCGCGRRGCLETHVSATGIKRTAFELMGTMTCDSELRSIPYDKFEAKMLSDAAAKNDPIALEAFERTGKMLGLALADLTAITSPEAIILFGGLANAGDYILRPTYRHMEENQLTVFKGKVKLLMSGIQDKNVAILGGAALIWKQHLEAVIENY